MRTIKKKILIPTLTESPKKVKAMCKWWLANVDENGNMKITSKDILRQKGKELNLV